MSPRLDIIVASTRPGRVGPAIGKWFHDAARTHGAFAPRLVDIADYELPVFDEPHHPAMGKYTKGHTRAWSDTIDAGDAFVFVTPEYNFTIPPSLSNALDFLHREWAYKPAGFVSYGGVSGGLRAVQSARAMITVFKMMPVPEGVAIPNFAQFLADDGSFHPNEMVEAGVVPMLGELAKWTAALQPLRAPLPAEVTA